jgi:hypothetical protein
MIEGRSDSEKGSWLFKPRVFFQFEFFSLGLWFCSEYFVVPTTEKATTEMAKGYVIFNRWPKETDPSIPPKKNIWKGAPHSASTQESNFQFRADYDKNVGEMLIALFFNQAAQEWSDGFRESCLGSLSSGITNPFVANPPANVQAMAKVFYEPPTDRGADANWWDEMQLRFN